MDGMLARVQDRQRRDVRTLSSLQRREARLCPYSHLVQPHVLGHADRYFQRDGHRHRHQVPNRWIDLQPQEASSENQGFDRHHQWLHLCRWLCPQRCLSSRYAAQHWLVLWCLQQLRHDYQFEEDRSDASAGPRQAVRRARHRQMDSDLTRWTTTTTTTIFYLHRFV